ncbi:hypothetical protein HYPSUDRAFT_202540 [Hypholoma sublateritium FD-334 SS-4]|uniref:Uncharacterized protein n=1 Tax=Hypholoma sublateritium (strain FD-334 SS-4) TaxID=945553 RepID=A0A0D2PQA0_HYPSF|nr:hypothetical protein HYPSUDRAFT_202540 [Hypholoma sublateritium FD-334 SS-4]
MASALELAKETYKWKKSRTALNLPEQQQPSQLNLQPAVPQVEVESNPISVSDNMEAESLLTLAERRPRRENCRLPLRYRVELPVQLPSLPPPSVVEQVASLPTREILKTPCNTFGLFRQYFAVSFPSHDPDSEVQSSDVSHSPTDDDPAESLSAKVFRPYPNKNAFLLGEWYWNGGLQKSKEDFKNLMNIICDQSFVPADIRDVPWDSLNEHLGESTDSEDAWLDQPDAGWKETNHGRWATAQRLG